MNVYIYNKNTLQCVMFFPKEMNLDINKTIESSVITNYGGNLSDYDYVETDKTNFRLERVNNGGVLVVGTEIKFVEPTIVENTPSKAEITFAEYILSTEERILNLEKAIDRR